MGACSEALPLFRHHVIKNLDGGEGGTEGLGFYNNVCVCVRGGSRIFQKGGHNTGFFPDRRQPRRASPKIADERGGGGGGGDSDTFFS